MANVSKIPWPTSDIYSHPPARHYVTAKSQQTVLVASTFTWAAMVGALPKANNAHRGSPAGSKARRLDVNGKTLH